ncbi:MAG: helix-turn-helix transcriptional regulator [Oscillospiraceae bacterium]
MSSVIKSARENADITIEALAAKIDISERYIYRIENEQKKPSFNVLLKLIRELAINSDLIFYPDKPCKDTEVEDLIRMLYNCDERSMAIIKATVKAALESQPQE